MRGPDCLKNRPLVLGGSTTLKTGDGQTIGPKTPGKRKSRDLRLDAPFEVLALSSNFFSSDRETGLHPGTYIVGAGGTAGR